MSGASLSILLQVGLGGALGAICRHLLVLASGRASAALGAPVGVPAANLLGGFAIGFLAVWLARMGAAPRLGPFLITGFLGGFTTFSAFSLDVLTLWERGRADLALGYVAVSVAGAIGAAALGAAFARALAPGA